MSNPLLDSMIPTFMTHGGVILIAVVLPLAAFLLLDGVVALARGKGVLPILVAAGLVIGIGVVGTVMWQGGLSQLEGSPSFAVTSGGAEGNFRMLFGWALGLGAIAFLIRMVRLTTGRKVRS